MSNPTTQPERDLDSIEMPNRVEPNMTIRDATVADAAVIAEIYNESIAAGHYTMDAHLKTPQDIADQISSFSKRETYMLLEKDGHALGWGVIKLYSHRPGYRFCAETSVYLRHAEVGKGYGSHIKRILIDRCKEYGYHHLIARIRASNETSIEYNKRFGYEMVGIQREIGYMNGQWQNIAVMQLVLDDVPAHIPEEYQ